MRIYECGVANTNRLQASDTSLSGDPQAVIPWVVKATEIGLATAAKNPSIKRVVLTSSAFAATLPQPGGAGIVVTEETWNEPAIKAAWDPNTPAEFKPGVVYSASKAEGERAAWKWVHENKPGYEFNAILPNFNVSVLFVQAALPPKALTHPRPERKSTLKSPVQL